MHNDRVIKFRSWDGTRFYYWGMGLLGKGTFTGSPNPMYLDTQFTGMFDKNGEEIYEGDIVKIDGIEYKIVFYNGSYNLVDVNNGIISNNLKNLLAKSKIVGNIFKK